MNELFICLPKLNTLNYIQLARAMEYFIRTKGLRGLVDGSKAELQFILTKAIYGKAYELEHKKRKL